MLKGLIFRVVGPPPTSESTSEERLRWIRKFYRFTLAAVVIVVIFAVLDGHPFMWVLAAVGAAWYVSGWLSLTRRIRRERSR